MQNPELFVRVSLPSGHHTVPAATAERGGWHVLEGHDAVDAKGRPLPPKLRDDMVAATPAQPDPETDDVEGDTEETE